MKRFCSFIIMLLGCQWLLAQHIQKMSADELNAYITKNEKPLVVSFWATWCASCNEEIPWFISTINQKHRDEVDLLLVSLDIKSYYPGRIAGFAKQRNYNASIVWLNESNADIFCPKIDPAWSGAIPSTLMVNNKKGFRKFYETGITERQFEQRINELVAP